MTPGAPSSRRARPEHPAASSPRTLEWVEERLLEARASEGRSSDAAAILVAQAPRRSLLRPAVLVPLLLLFVAVGAYVAATLLWPLTALTPEVEPVPVPVATAPAAAPAWPLDGGAALTVAGAGATLSSSNEPESIASITKLVTALIVLEKMPLAAGEQGPAFAFTAADRQQYLDDRAAGESAIDVPVDGALTLYQMLEGLLVGSANNYADRLSRDLFGSDAAFVEVARAWLATHGLAGISIADPSGIVEANAATPESLIPLAVKAMQHPVIAEIVAKPTVDLPGAGRVENTNVLLSDPGVVGLKTGTLDSYNLLAAKDVVVAGTTVRLYASVLGQPNRLDRDAATRALFAQLERDLQPQPSVPAGTRVGEAVTAWGESVDVVTADDATVVLWNGGSATPSADIEVGEVVAEGTTVGSLSVTGPLDTDTVEVRLADEIEPPTAWWRLTHPLELFGLTDER